MAKTLLLVRHAKSSWDISGIHDYERPLLPEGIERTLEVADFLVDKGVHPDLIISSHAVRAIETARLIAGKLGYPEEKIETDSNIYYQGSDTLFDLVMDLPDNRDVVVLVGHNPAMTQFANMFLDDAVNYLPTTGVACVTFDVTSWSHITEQAPHVLFYITPKLLKK